MTVLQFTVGQRTFSDQIFNLSARMRIYRNTCLIESTEVMASNTAKRLGSTNDSTSSSEDGVAAKRRVVLSRTVDKWITENDRSMNTSTWLTYERLNRECVCCLKCGVCIRFRDKLGTCRNYSSAFIDGSQNLRSSAFKDHAKSDMHQRAMLLLRKASAVAVTDYSSCLDFIFIFIFIEHE